MKNNPLFSIVAESLDRMFIVDKQGKTIFFPWGSKKQGYYIKNKNAATKIKKLYRVSFYACFIFLIIALSFFGENFWGIISSMVICFGSWYFAYFFICFQNCEILAACQSKLQRAYSCQI